MASASMWAPGRSVHLARIDQNYLKTHCRKAIRPTCLGMCNHSNENAQKKKCKKVKIFTFFDFFSACPMKILKIFIKITRPADEKIKIWKILTKKCKNGQKWNIFDQSGPVARSQTWLQSGASLEFHSIWNSWPNLTTEGHIYEFKNSLNF